MKPALSVAHPFPDYAQRSNVPWHLLMLSDLWLFATPWTAARQASLSMGCPRQGYWSVGCHFLLQGDLPNPGIEHASPALTGRFFTIASPREPYCDTYMCPSGPGLGCLHAFGPGSHYLNSHPQGSITTFIPLYDSECGSDFSSPGKFSLIPQTVCGGSWPLLPAFSVFASI